MGIMTIDGREVEFTNEKNVLSVIRKAGINVPTLCYQPELSIYGACRLCTVEDSRGKLFASCSEEPRDGMVIYTNTPKLKKYRKMIVELLLAAHCRDCTICDKTGNCVLQDLSYKMGIKEVPYENTRERQPIDESSYSIVRDPNKCVLCGNCVRACRELQGVETLGIAFRGTDATVMPAFNKGMGETDCVGCGQCRVVCPTGAITIRSNIDDVWDVLADPNTRVVAQIAPSVRVAVGDAFGLPKGKSSIGKVVNILHRMGFDEVYDTNFSADMTIMEESAEFLNRVKNGGTLPLFTSCCPAWVKFVVEQYPEYKENLSTCRSPQGMLSAVIKEWYRDPSRADGKRTVVVSFMPCTAKKMEIKRPNSFTKGEQDTDYVVTTTELVKMIQASGINFAELEPEQPDEPFGLATGGGAIFGVTGGVTEAVIRRLVPEHDQATIDAIAEFGMRGDQPIKEFTVKYDGMDVNVCVVSGLANAHEALRRVKTGEANYHLIEVMACKGGCVMGGGQPVKAGECMSAIRTEGMYEIDAQSQFKAPDENPALQKLYAEFLDGKTHELLHNEGY
ncbi:MAG: [FeFe] hydrogenase, group A [Firmicutes bacterium]|nr:[FeFe] hydrogenase, group A [Blautia sp.]MDD7371756.1 [FeFe] hydrogenase, group A [Bacillota bacterium]MDY3715456.1 [FeFe] hydrogenase, group A [Blautia sp.]